MDTQRAIDPKLTNIQSCYSWAHVNGPRWIHGSSSPRTFPYSSAVWLFNSFLTVNGKSRSWVELFSKYFVHVNVHLNLKRCASLRNRHHRKTLFVVDVSVNWAASRRWQTKLRDAWNVTQIYLLRQGSVKVPATCWCIPGTDLLRRLFMLPIRTCGSDFSSHPVTVY